MQLFGRYHRRHPDDIATYTLYHSAYAAERAMEREDRDRRARYTRDYGYVPDWVSLPLTDEIVRPLRWQDRENAKFYCGDLYTHPVWCGENFWHAYTQRHRDHYLHISLEDPRMVAFTEDAAKGEADRQTRMKPGKYLRRFFGDVLTDKQIAFYAEWFAAGERPVEEVEGGLRFATTADEIVEVYENGPSSCMRGKDCVRVYAAGDLAVAYFEPQEGQVTARALCWPERKVFGRVYPSTSEAEGANLWAHLRAQGFKSLEEDKTGFDGARILAERDGRAFVMPYLDGVGLNFRGDHFTLAYSGDYDSERTDGTLYLDGEDGMVECDRCGDDFDEDETSTVYTSTGSGGFGGTDGERWCSGCGGYHTFFCNGFNETFSDDAVDSIEIEGTTYSLAYAEHRGHFYCDATDEHRFADDGSVEMANGQTWAADHFADHGFTCGYDEENYPNEEMSKLYPGFPAAMDDDDISPEARALYALGFGPCPDTLELPLEIAA